MRENNMISGPQKMIAVLLILLLATTAPMNAAAAATERFLESYETQEGKVKVYCADLGADTVPSQEQFAVTLGSQKVPISEISTIEQQNTPVTYYCMTDVSGSMKQEQMEQAKAILTFLCDSMGEKDNMVVGSLGNHLTTSDFLADKNAIHAEIDALQAGNEDTNLYQGIVNSITALKEDSRVNRKKCLIILSDGEDDQKSGITQSEAEQAVHNSAIPVYTVATLRQSQTEEQIESAKLLGSFARISAGGVNYSPAIDGADAQTVGQDILNNVKHGVVVTLDTSQVTAGKDVLLLRMTFTASDQSIREDTMEVFAEDLQFAQAEGQGETEDQTQAENSADTNKKEKNDQTKKSDDTKKTDSKKTDSEESKDDEEESDDTNTFNYIFLIVAGSVLAVILILTIILTIRKNKKRQREEAEEDRERESEEKVKHQEQVEVWEQSPQAWRRNPQAWERRDAARPAGTQQTASQNAEFDYEVRFDAIGYEHLSYTLRMPKGRIMTLGRDGRADLILNAQDNRLSGVHCKIRCNSDRLNIWDADSKNGTFVNGVPIMKMGMATVENGQTVRMGGYEYRVTIKKRS